MTSLALVPVQPNLATDIKRQEIIKTIQDRITALNLPLNQYKTNTEFVLLVLNLIEHLVPKQKKEKKKIDKKQLAIDILSTMLGLNPAEQVTLGVNIEFLHSNKMIKRINKFVLFCVGASEYFGLKKK
jgi:hypothetical protein